MIAYVAATSVVLGFVVLVKVCQVLETTKEILRITKLVGETLRSKTLSDREKETNLQTYSKSLAKLCVVICIKLGVALALPLALLWGFDKIGLVRLDASMSVLLSWPFLLVSSVVMVAGLLLIIFWRKPRT